jgi:hypothetical protein
MQDRAAELRRLQKYDDGLYWSENPAAIRKLTHTEDFIKERQRKWSLTKQARRKERMQTDAEYAEHKRAIAKASWKRRAYTEEQRDARRAAFRARYHTRLKQTPEWKVKHNLRIRLRKFLFGHKSLSMPELLGCSQPTLIKHLEKHMKRGMTWKNYGTTWHIDHILPCASFDLTDPDQQRKCFHFSNLRPEWAQVNQSKGKKIVVCQPELLLAV